MKETIVKRLEEAGLGADRIINVEDGAKRSFNHEHRQPEDISGNYGVHACASDELVILDVDDYKELDDSSGFTALADLPPTLEEKTPHGGTHRFYRVPVSDGRFIAAIFEDEFGAQNPNPSWGEVRAAGQYVVAAGSELDGCGKDGCEACATDDGGRYLINEDTEIAEVDADTIVDVLSRDPVLDDGSGSTGDESSTDVDGILDVLDYALEESDDDKLKRLWKGNYTDYDDRSEAESALAYKLAFWLQGDKQAVRRAMDKAETKKWAERTDDSYRESVLDAVDECSEYYDPESNTKECSDGDGDDTADEESSWVECSRDDPAGNLHCQAGCYGHLVQHRDDDGEMYETFNSVTNFTLETIEHLKTSDSELLKIRVHPSHPMGEEYVVDVHPTVFNTTRTFKEEIVRGKTTRYEPGGKTQQVLNDLRETVGSQVVPKRTGVEHIGLHGDEYNEWVTPNGTVTENGEADDPDYRYYAKGGTADSDGGALARKWDIDPEDVGEFNEDDVASIVELLPKTRRHDRGLPILGWFYAAPLRPLIHDWEDEFNLLQVVGSTETGKTSTLKLLWEAFGMEPDPFSASDTPFTLMKHMASSCGVPVWIDEYKPADIRNDRLDTLHRRLREVTKGTAVSKGQANLGEVLFEIKAPVVVSGEQRFSESVTAVRRRAIMTTLSDEATEDGSSYTRAFSRLTGTSYEDENGVNYPSGYDLEEHAKAYYQYILSSSSDELEELWNQCHVDAGELLSSRDLKFDSSEFQGAQTILFGIRLLKRFADTVGADISQLPTDDEVADAFEHFADNIGNNGQRRGYGDIFLELFAQAAKNEYVERGEDYRFIQSQKWGEEVLAFHMPSVYAGVKRYVRDYNLEDEYNLIGKNDYISSFKDDIGDDSHVLKINHKARLGGGPTKCVVLNPSRAHQKLGTDFELRAFDEDAGEDGDESVESGVGRPIDDRTGKELKKISELDVGDSIETVSVEVETWDTDDSPLELDGCVRDVSGMINVVSFDEIVASVEEGDFVVLSNVSVSEFEGNKQLRIGSETEIVEIEEGTAFAPESSVESSQTSILSNMGEEA